MDLKMICKSARYAVLKIEDGGTYGASRIYHTHLSRESIWGTEEAVTSIYNLKSDTGYQAETKSRDSLVFKAFFATDSEYVALDVRGFRIKGDGVQDNTLFIQAAIIAYPEESRVLAPARTYRIVSLFLKNNMNTELVEEAVLSAYTDRTRFPVFQGMIQSYDEQGKYNLDTWEGNPLFAFTGITTSANAEEAVVYGQGVIDGSAGTGEGNWRHESKVIHTACCLRTTFLERYRQVMVQGITMRNSPGWNIYPCSPDHLRFSDLRVPSPEDLPNTSGLDPESYRDMEIAGVCFSVGDDCITIRSGEIYMGSIYKYPSKNISIRRCCIRDGHGSTTVGSEMTDGVEDLTVKGCMLLHMDRGLHIRTHRGRGEGAAVDRIVFGRIRMGHVMAPFVINCFYLCDLDGHGEYMRTKEALLVDNKAPFIKSLCFGDIEVENCHVTATYMCDLPEQRVRWVEMERVRIGYATPVGEGQPVMMGGCDFHICRTGIYVDQIEELVLRGVRAEGQDGPVIITESIGCVYGSA